MHEGVYNFCFTDSTEIFFSKLWSAGLNYNLPSFFTDSNCAGVSNKYCLLTFFIGIKIVDFEKYLGDLTDCSLYVDDFCICCHSKSMGTIERQLQQNLNGNENWATGSGFGFSKSGA